MKKLIVPTIGALLLLTGCSTTSQNIEKSEKKKYIKYDNTNHVFGDENKAIEVLTYNQIINGKQDVKITFNIDKFPYYKEFNLCEDKQSFKRLKSVQKVDNGPDKVEYVDEKIDCSGYIKVSKGFKKEDIIGSFKFNILKGFNVQDFRGHDLLLKEIQESSTSYTFFESEFLQEGLDGKKENFWTRTKK